MCTGLNPQGHSSLHLYYSGKPVFDLPCMETEPMLRLHVSKISMIAITKKLFSMVSMYAICFSFNGKSEIPTKMSVLEATDICILSLQQSLCCNY